MDTALDIHRHALRLCEFHVEIKDVDVEKRTIRGFASTPAIDKYQDIVDPKAFSKTMSDYMKNGSVLAHHNPRTPIGKPKDYEISDKGLWIESNIATGLHPLDHKEQTWNEIVQGLLKGLSIGFRILKDESIDPNSDEGKRGAVRRVTMLRLFEHSVVTIPAGEGTWFSVAKGLQYGSDSPVDLYNRGHWPDEREPMNRRDALDLYWSGLWPNVSSRALRSRVAPDTPDDGTDNEGVDDGQSRDLTAGVVSLRARTALMTADARLAKE
jgi:HK97 family phage prohead protease